jgi:hypothetical protein
MKRKLVLGIVVVAVIAAVAMFAGCIEEPEITPTPTPSPTPISTTSPTPSPTTSPTPKMEIEWFQAGNTLAITQLETKLSEELEDNRIGGTWDLVSPDYYGEPDEFIHGVSKVGLKRVRLSLDHGTWDMVDWSEGEYSKYYVEPHQDKTITGLADNDIKMMYCLVFWDVESPGKEVEEGYSRFKTEDEIQRYLDYVQFIVHNFKDRIEYYEIWNEPESWEGTQQYIELADYINLVKRTVPVIREEYPDAKIVVGATCNLRFPHAREYTFGILKSDVMPLVDAVSLHPMYGASPEYDYYREYYYNYPSLIQEIKDVASTHGFKGEYIAEEMCWRTVQEPNPDETWTYSKTVAAKYYARAIIIHLGLNVTAGLGEIGPVADSPKMRVIQNLCTIMAGAEPTNLSIEIQSKATNIKNYSFSLPNGDKLIALWTDSAAVDEDLGVKANLTLRGFTAQDVMGNEVIEGFQQLIITSNENENLIIQNLIVRDYPLILRIAKSSTQ